MLPGRSVRQPLFEGRGGVHGCGSKAPRVVFWDFEAVFELRVQILWVSGYAFLATKC